MSSHEESCEIQSEADEELVLPGETCALTLRGAKQIGDSYEQAMMESVHVLCNQKLRVLEVGGPESSGLSQECEKYFGAGSSMWLSDWNGGDLETPQGREFILEAIKENMPVCVFGVDPTLVRTL